MRNKITRRRVIQGAAASASWISIADAAKAGYFGGSVPVGAGNSTLATLTINNVGASNTNTFSSAFWEFGQPFGDGDVPSGSIVTATVGGVSVPLQAIARSTHGSSGVSPGSLKWGLFHVDLTGISIPASGSANLVLSSSAGSWSSTTSRTNADWVGLVDTVELTNLSTTSASAADMDGAGTWIAKFDNATGNTLETIGTSPLGLRVKVTADFKNGATTHRFLRACMEYWVAQLAGGGVGPIASFGPFIENTRMLKTAPGKFTWDINFKRNAVSQRSMTGVPQVAATLLPFCRPDAQFDWTANEPAVVVTRSISELRKTKKIASYINGLAYGLPTEATITGISGAVFTASGGIAGVVAPVNAAGLPIAVSFRTTGTIWGGGSTTTTYWLVPLSTTTFSLYDTQPHAVTAGATGLITPTNAGTGTHFARVDVAPASPATIYQAIGDPGARLDISLNSEYAVCWIFADGSAGAGGVAAAQHAQRMARAACCAMSGQGMQLLDDSTNKVLSFLPRSQTPNAMLPTGTNDYSGAIFTGLNIGGTWPQTLPTGGANGWGDAGGNYEHMPMPLYIPWLLDGKAYYRDLLFYYATFSLTSPSQQRYSPAINYTDASVGGGTTYYRNFTLNNGEALRGSGWNLRNIGFALMACADGSPEYTYFTQAVKNGLDLLIAFAAYKGSAYQSLSIYVYDHGDWPASSFNLTASVAEGFMQIYYATASQLFAMQHIDNPTINTNLVTVANTYGTYLVNLHNQLGYVATSYTISPRATRMGSAGPGTYQSSLANCGLGPGSNILFSYNGSTGVITWSNADPWWTLTVGDQFIPENFYSLDTNLGSTPTTADPPTGLVAGTIYTIATVNTSLKQFTLTGHSTYPASPSNLGGTLLPTNSQATFPTTNFISDDIGGLGSPGPDGYGAHLICALGLAAVRGVTGAATAYTNANNRYALGTPLNYTQRADWYCGATV